MTRELDALVEQLDDARAHVLATVDGLGEEQLTYRRWSRHNGDLLQTVDLDAPPRWWPSRDLFPFPAFPDARRCGLTLLVETTTHAGQLDIVREGIDGHQHLVVS